MLDNGNILVLDNGRFSVNFWPPDFSRVIEVSLRTKKIKWEYVADNPVDFHTTYIGGCERLPNGNTLICEGAKGRFFEVTETGEIVWEYLVPFYARHLSPRFGLTNATYRCHRYSPDYAGLPADKLGLLNIVYGPTSLQPRIKSFEVNTEELPCNTRNTSKSR